MNNISSLISLPDSISIPNNPPKKEVIKEDENIPAPNLENPIFDTRVFGVREAVWTYFPKKIQFYGSVSNI
jgi:hypothetical protein